MVRPLLDYCVPVWVLYKKDIEVLEKVQKKATNITIIPEIRHLAYRERLKASFQRYISDKSADEIMIEMYKILTGKYDKC